MDKNYGILFIVALISLPTVIAGKPYNNTFSYPKVIPPRVTLQSLLLEMTAPDVLARFPDPAYQLMEASSYNRESISPTERSWFADSDGTGYIREENINGKNEYVIMEHTGPGCITRMWTPFFYYALNNHQGPNIHIYIDGKPVITANFIQLLTGKSFIHVPFANLTARAGVAYLPIPFSKSCKITLDQKPFYYCINYRSYPKGTWVTSFSQKAYEQAKDRLRQSAYALLHPDKKGKIKMSRTFSVQLKKNAPTAFTLPAGPIAISYLKFIMDKTTSSDVLRNVGLKITFDGQKTVWCPLGAFFCGADDSFQTKYMTVNDNSMVSRWVMPYQASAKIELVNFNDEPINLLLEIQYKAWQWDKRSMYFHADWVDYGYLPGDKFFDLNFIHIKGKGVLAGDALTVLSPGIGWWGEGDEKIYIDDDIGRNFPSHFGTGTEDYYGWAGGEVPTGKDTFSIPFGANIKNGNAENPRGYNISARIRGLDAIPFQKVLKFDMEASPGVDIRHNYNLLSYSMMSYWYGCSGSVANRKPTTQQLKQKLMTLPEIDILEREIKSGNIILNDTLLERKIEALKGPSH